MRRQGQAPAQRRSALVAARPGVALLLLLAMHAGLGATALEYKVKAAYLFNCFLFVDWPQQAFKDHDDGFDLCVIGRDPLGQSLAQITRKTAQRRPIALHRLRDDGDIGGCHVLFIGASESGRLSQILRQAEDSHTLTVSELPGFAGHGGMVGFRVEGGKVRIEVNLASVRRAGLRISSKLLEVAAEVYRR